MRMFEWDQSSDYKAERGRDYSMPMVNRHEMKRT